MNEDLDEYVDAVDFGKPHEHMENASSTSRRDRLAALRRRMREEFGARELTPLCGLTNDCDSLSLASETASMHSWHRHVIANAQTVVVHPCDSISTRAGPSSLPNPLTQCQLETNTTSEPPILPSSSYPVVSCVSASMTPTGPPPTHPPPPLPDPASIRSPPPLPPRNRSVRLPEPITEDFITRLNFSDDAVSHPPPKTISTLEKLSTSLVETAHQSPSQNHRASSTSNDSVASSADRVHGSVRRRGHMKTNSLDRGLTLAKSLKAGPFPPPSNKSNSLTRQERDDFGEECARNTAAEGVILQITTTIIGDQSSRSGDLEPIASESSSVSSSSERLGAGEANLSKSPVLDEKVKYIGGEEINNETSYKSMNSGSTGNTSGIRDLVLCSSVDPITRDVERRMSMKLDFPLHSESINDDTRSERFSHSRPSIDYAKTWARSYGSFASSLFREALHKMKIMTNSSSSMKGDDTSESEGDQSESGLPSTAHPGSLVRPRKGKKGPFDFEQLKVVQELSNEHTGAVWSIRFSVCGRLMATAGQDNMIRVWAARSHLKYFVQMRERYQHKNSSDSRNSPSEVFQAAVHDIESFRPPSSSGSNAQGESNYDDDDTTNLFSVKPFVVFKGHTADILDLSWSKNYFILSSGMDRTVKLWHLSRNECLCCFQHVDFVTSVAFLPKDDRYFLSGSLDGKLRMWHIPDKKVAVWNEVPVKFITAIAFVKNGKFAVVGTYNGRCFFYSTDQLKYHTVVDVRSSRGKNARGHKVTGLAVHGDKLLVTSNDSRIRMYDVRDKALTCKFRGAQNEHSQIRAAFSPDGRHIVCGSEDKFIYFWRTSDLPSTLSVRKDRNAMWERIRVHSAPVSVAVFAPKPNVYLSMFNKQDEESRDSSLFSTTQQVCAVHVIVSADLQGTIKIMVNKSKASKTGINALPAQD